MYSILLVDDEKSIREHLTKVIPFEEHGFIVRNTALNGKEALEKLSVTCPDLILLDVRMPVMDGLEFLKQLRQGEYAHTPVVMLSGYNEFVYAKEAMKYGVKAYLNKPVDEEEMIPLLHKVHKELDDYKNEKDRSMLLENMKIFNKLYNGGAIARSIFKGYTFMSCVLLQCTCSMESNDPHVIMQECLSKQIGELDSYQFRTKGSQYSFLLPPKVMEPYCYNKKALADKLQEELRKEDLFCAFLFDSYIFEDSQDTFREDFSNHNYEMLTELFFSGGKFMDYSPNRYKTGEELYLESKCLDEIKQDLLSLDKKKVILDFENLTDQIQKEHTGIQYVQEISYRIYYLINNEMSKIVSTKQGEMFLARPKWIDSPCFVSFHQWKKVMYSLVMEGFGFIEQSCRVVSLGASKAVVEYIKLHYTEQISLKQVADLFFVNAAYLGRVFQKTTGLSFKEYVNRIRICEAKKLLLQTDKLIYEIANQVGFLESSYFIVKFSQEVGKSPTEYRNEMKRNELHDLYGGHRN